MAVRIYFEIGHEASIRNKKTLEGFTHDWEVFVRGCDGAEIHYFVEKVVFYLHETFPKPKRVIKEPPYSLKESGYAGFNLPIEIYLRNNNEPKKIRFNYDLHLQNVGPPINKVQKEKYVFTNCTEEFKSRLLKGGGIISSKSEFDDNRQGGDEKNHQMINKPKLSGCDIKKQKTVGAGEPSREFNAIFGSPILTSKTNAEKQVPQIKSQEMKDKSRNKHSPQKDSHRDKDKGRSEEKKAKEGKVSKDKGKERERSKDKTVKKERSPQRPKSPSPRVSSSPPPAKHSPARFSSPTIRHKDSSKSSHEKQREEKRQKKRHKESGGKHADEAVGKSGDSKQQHKEIVGKSDKKDQISATVGKIKSESPKRDKSKESGKYQSRDNLPKDEKSSDKSYEKNKYKKKDKKEREKKDDKLHPVPSKSDKKEQQLKLNLFKSEATTMKKEKPFANMDESSSSSTSSSSSSSERLEKKIKIEPAAKPMIVQPEKKVKKEKNYQDSAIKCKRKATGLELKEQQPPEKVHKELMNNNSDADAEPVTKLGNISQETEEDYFGVLRDLQQKIMGLKDNSDLQKVVQLIAETGRFEVSAHTFDFDLCLLDRSTVKQLQEFFTQETS